MAANQTTTPTARSRASLSIDLAALKKRAKDLGYELVVSDLGEQFLLGGRLGLEVVFIHREESDDELGAWLDNNGERHATYEPDEATVAEATAARRRRESAARARARRPDDAERDMRDSIFGVAAVVNSLAERLHEHGSLGADAERGPHDHALVALLERECARAMKLAGGGA